MTANYIAIVGPTGSGKSHLALAIAEKFPCEIISCDSVQVYRGFNIGSAKPSLEEQRLVPHHLIDICDFHEDFDAFDYAALAQQKIKDCLSRGRLPLVVGGTGLYLRALWGDRFNDFPSDLLLREAVKQLATEELYTELKSKDPEKAATIHANDRLRIVRAVEILRITNKTHAELLREKPPDFPPALALFIHPSRSLVRAQIARRVEVMLKAGWIDEVKTLLAQGCGKQHKPMQSIGYSQIADFLIDGGDENMLAPNISTVTCQYAKRQVSWFKKLQCKTKTLAEPNLTEELLNEIKKAGYA